jgi:hypothetical protein
MLLRQVQQQHGITDLVLSAISVVELEHGIYRAQAPQLLADGLSRDTRSTIHL